MFYSTFFDVAVIVGQLSVSFLWFGEPMASSSTATTHTKGVLDLTFHDLKDETDVATALASDRVTALPLATTAALSSAGAEKKKVTLEEIKAIRIANNEIADAKALCSPFTSFMDTSKVSWLDLSFNRIEKIDLELFKAFPNVTTLYLQANQIAKLSELKKLAGFTSLKVTMCGPEEPIIPNQLRRPSPFSPLSPCQSLAIYGNPVEGALVVAGGQVVSCRKRSSSFSPLSLF